jgi:transcriptional regulator with XRE-family HTH domain
MTEQEYYIKLGQDFRALRELKGVSQTDLARKIGIPSSIISEFENKGTKVSAYRIEQMMEILTGESLFSSEKKTTLRSVLPAGSVN